MANSGGQILNRRKPRPDGTKVIDSSRARAKRALEGTLQELRRLRAGGPPASR